MFPEVQLHERRAVRGAATIALLLACAVAASASQPGPAAAQVDEPSVEQYTDPFGPLGTGRRAPAWNPFSDDFAAPSPERLLRRLRRLDDGPALEMLLAQLETERARTTERSGPGGVRSGPRPRRPPAAGEDEASGALGSAVSSAFDGGGPGGALLVAGLIAVAIAGVVAARSGRRREGR